MRLFYVGVGAGAGEDVRLLTTEDWGRTWAWSEPAWANPGAALVCEQQAPTTAEQHSATTSSSHTLGQTGHRGTQRDAFTEVKVKHGTSALGVVGPHGLLSCRGEGGLH